MKPIEYIRKHILKLTQVEFAAVAGSTQATVSRWETGDSEPSLAELRAIRLAAAERGIPLSDSAFFDAPPEVEKAAS